MAGRGLRGHGHREAELPAIVGLASYLLSTALLVVPLVSLRRRGRLPAGAVATIVAFVALPAAALSEMRFGLPAITAVLAGLGLELLLWRRPETSTVALAVLVPGVVWSAQLAGLALRRELGWAVEMWSGVVVLTMLGSFMLAKLSEPAARAARVPGRTTDVVVDREA